jgi:hypothetical protein
VKSFLKHRKCSSRLGATHSLGPTRGKLEMFEKDEPIYFQGEASITFNGKKYSRMKIEYSAQKHYREENCLKNIEPVFKKIFNSLDQQRRNPDLDSTADQAKFTVASCTSGEIGFAQPYRSTRFKDAGEKETLSFFHNSPRREGEYENKYDEHQKKRQE